MDYRALPKIDLHRHLEGSIRFNTLVELARDVGLELKRGELRHQTTMRGQRPGFTRFLSKFDIYSSIWPSRDWIERVAREAVEDARDDGVVHLELRFSPAHFARRLGAPGEEVASWVARGARRARLPVRFIATLGRHFTLKQNHPTIRAVLETNLFSAIDIAGDENRSARPFLPFCKRAGLPLTIHAGEAGGAARVREAIEVFGARRIGHGVRVLEDTRTISLALKRNIVFEVCPTSEIQTGIAKSWKNHPIRRMREEGLQVTINTDDPTVCGTTLSRELRQSRRAGISRADLSGMAVQAANAAFLPPATRRRLARQLAGEWERSL